MWERKGQGHLGPCLIFLWNLWSSTVLADALMEPLFNTLCMDQRVIEDRRSRPTSFVSTLKFGGRRKTFRRKGEGQNRYVDCLSFRSFVLVLSIFALSTLDVIFTRIHLQNGGAELNPLMRQVIQTSFPLAFIIKSLGVGFIGCFLGIHQNFKISFYSMHVITAIYSALLVYHIVSSYLFWGI